MRKKVSIIMILILMISAITIIGEQSLEKGYHLLADDEVYEWEFYDGGKLDKR